MPAGFPYLNYDTLAADYARHRRVHPGVLRDLVEIGGITVESKILEVGCGTGNYLHAIHDLTGCDAWGIDPSAAMLARARERGGAVTLRQGRAERLEAPDASFDLIFSVDVIHHVGDRDAFFTEARRVLRPGGRLCTATDSHEDIPQRIPLSTYFPEMIPVELARYPSIPTLRAEMERAGFTELAEGHVDLRYTLTDAQPYRDRAFSSLHLIDLAAFERGLARLEADLARSPISGLSLYTLLWGVS
jgi:SAM-dependent methyltransferase